MDGPALHGRVDERRALEAATELAVAGSPQMTVMMGRRRVGKTFLLQHHLMTTKSAATCYHAAARLAEIDEIHDTWDRLRAAVPELSSIDSPSSWSALFDRLVDAATRTPVVMVLDEAPYLIEGSRSFAAELQRSWDRARHMLQPVRLHLILTGSALATIAELVSSQGALYERPNRMIRLEPFDLPTSASFIRARSGVEAIEAFAATGGYPLLLGRWDTGSSATANLVRLAGDPMGPLTTNASSMLLDLPQSEPYMRIMTAIGRGASRFSEISSHAGVRVERPLHSLGRAGYINKIRPIGQTRGDPLYELADQYLRFWFALIERDIQLIDAGQGAAVLDAALPRWQVHLGDTFERAARSHLVRLVGAGELPSDMLVGRWWTHRPRQIELDAVGLRGRSWHLVAEAKWSERFTRTDLAQLMGARAELRQAQNTRLALFTRSAFAPDVAAATEGALRFTADDLIA